MRNEARREHVVEIEGQQYSVELYYDKGGINYFSGSSERRGYRLCVLPCKVEERNGFIIRSHDVFGSGGKRFLIEEAPRFNAKRWQSLRDLLSPEKAREIAAQFRAGSFDTIIPLLTTKIPA